MDFGWVEGGYMVVEVEVCVVLSYVEVDVTVVMRTGLFHHSNECTF